MTNRLLLAAILCFAPLTVSWAQDSSELTENETYSVNTFYALLVAEMAGQRQLYDLALGNYLLESHRTQDPGVTARATQIAQFIGADQAALDAATLWVKLDEKNPLAQVALSSELVKAARFSESVLHLQQALYLDPLLNVNFISTQGNDLTEGARELWLETLTPLASQFSENQALLFNIASLHQQQGNNDQAIKICERLMEYHPSFYPAWSLNARILANDDQHKEALNIVNKALEQFQSDKSFTLLKARLLIKLKNILQAEAVFNQLSVLDPNDPHILLPLALTQLDLEKYQEAKLTFQKLLNLQQFQNEAHFYLGRIEEHLSNSNAALEHYLAMTSGREYLSAQGAIVNIYLKNEQIDTAINHIQQQRNIDHENESTYFLMEIDVLNRTNQPLAAMEVSNKGISLYPNNKKMRYARAMVAEKLGQLSVLEADLQHIIEIDPNNSIALNALGYTLADRNIRLQEALSFIQQAQAINPKDPAIMDSLGWVYFRLGQFDQSITLLVQAFEIFPDAEVAAHLGEVLWSTGKHQQAKDIWKKALEKEPQSSILLQTLQRLDIDL
ncbi:tetratricopeptide repeat protein [Oceaniserpentilla sp. 4NH20-0058]|uniref:tetratricopeptide repeat protein n=1 Tax=Oceaniserpentilla sp. 4NH20-0058 TaxID=3127660 RepID=UPI0031092FDE